MNNDIVTRLRICESEYGSGDTCREAAEEIERLRGLVHGYRMCAFELYSGIHGDSQFAKAGEGVRISAITAEAMNGWLQYDHVHWKDDALHEE